MSDSLQPHGLKNSRLPCPSLSPRVGSNINQWWCHPTISCSVIPFFSCPQCLPASGSFPMSWLFPSGGKSIRASASASVHPMNYSGLISFRIDWFDLLAVQGTLKSLLQYHSSKASILQCSALFMVQLSHPYMNTGKTIALTIWTFVSKVMSLLFSMLSAAAKSLQSCPTLCDPHRLQHITNCQSLLKLMFIESVMPFNHLILCCPLLLPPLIFPSIRVFSNESTLHIRWPKSIGVSASKSVLPMNIQEWFPLGWAGWISLLSKGLSRVFSNTTVQKHQFFGTQLSLWSTTHIHTWLLEKS